MVYFCGFFIFLSVFFHSFHWFLIFFSFSVCEEYPERHISRLLLSSLFDYKEFLGCKFHQKMLEDMSKCSIGFCRSKILLILREFQTLMGLRLMGNNDLLQLLS